MSQPTPAIVEAFPRASPPPPRGMVVAAPKSTPSEHSDGSGSHALVLHDGRWRKTSAQLSRGDNLSPLTAGQSKPLHRGTTSQSVVEAVTP